ncbi:MAG: putative short chain dehydrogenase/reductase [Acidimicrobiales bacterium]|nr:putative short chain dehydrogenase/reductase [Acidimicrobiales bacterium]
MSRPIALVTGASRGIGKAAAIDLAAAGYDVAIAARTLTEGTGRTDDDGTAVPGGLDTTAARIEEEGGQALLIPMDLLDRTSVEAAADTTLEKFGRIDLLVNNAIYQGSGVLDLFLDVADDDLHKLFEGNVFAQLALLRKVLPAMLESGGGTVINMVSGAGFDQPPAKVGSGGWSMGYAMTKAAFGRVAPLLHVEHGDQGIRAFSVEPGFVVTEKTEATGRSAKYAAHFRPATPDVIGRCIRWLATEPTEADELLGTTVYAQREVKRRGLLPGWPPPKD